MADSGRKDDTGKIRYDLIPAYPLERLAEVYTIGAKKYADRNWEKGLSYGRVFSAMMRHAWAWWRGETHDPVDGQHHLSSVAWCAFALMEYQHKSTGEDDRPIQVVAAAPVQVDWAEPEDHQQERIVPRWISDNEFVACSDCHSHVCIVAGTCTHSWQRHRG